MRVLHLPSRPLQMPLTQIEESVRKSTAFRQDSVACATYTCG
jgi:hypothetical protein